jgi:hypothetical protein
MMNSKYYYICTLPNQTTDMRKYLIVMAAVLLCCSVSFGQKKNNTSVGVKAGINLSQFRLPLDYDNYNADWKGGLAGGVFVERKLNSKFDLQVEFLYSQMGAKVDDDLGQPQNYRFNYFSVPLIVKLKAFKSIKVFAGPQCDFLLRATNRNDFGTHVVTNDTKDIDLGWTAGFEGWAANRYSIGLRYISGTKDVSPQKETFTGYNQSFQFSIGYRVFPCAKTKKK